MPEDPVVARGAAAGLIAGLAGAVYYYMNMPTIEEVVEAAREAGAGDTLGPGDFKLRLALVLAGLLAVPVVSVIGLLSAWASGKLARGRIGRALVSILLMALVMLGPDLAMGEGVDAYGAVTATVYGVSMLLLSARGAFQRCTSVEARWRGCYEA